MTRREFRDCPECNKHELVMYSWASGGKNHYKLECGYVIIEDRMAKKKAASKPPEHKQGGFL